MSLLGYSMLIQWSDVDKAYSVIIPEIPDCKATGDTYEEAAKNGREALEELIESGKFTPEDTDGDEDEEATVESILEDIGSFVARAEKRTTYPTTPETKKFLRMCAKGIKESVAQLEIAIEQRPLGPVNR